MDLMLTSFTPYRAQVETRGRRTAAAEGAFAVGARELSRRLSQPHSCCKGADQIPRGVGVSGR